MDALINTPLNHPMLATWRCKYQLPGDPQNDVYLLPVSGGADSSALAIVMHILYPEVQFHMCFTDTGAEPEECYATLDRLEGYLGKTIERVSNGKTLWDLIDQYKGFLPSSQARWCTVQLKKTAFEAWIAKFKGKTKHMFVGIRADENDRIGFALDEVTTEFPLIAMGVVREDVFSILSSTIGIPSWYRVRTRSGCSTCMFQRRSEVVGLMQAQPIEFIKGKKYEKLAEADLGRQEPAPDLCRESGLTLNHMGFPRPREGEEIVGKVGVKGESIFGDQGIWFGVEFFEDTYMGIEVITWHQRLVSYSTTLGGIKRQLQDRYEHLLKTSEVYEMTPDDVRQQVRFAVYYVEAPTGVLDIAGPSKGTYTWQQGTSYQQLQHIVTWGTRILHAALLDETARKKEKVNPLSWMYEQAQGCEKALSQVTNEMGRLVQRGWFKATEPVISEEFDERYVPCPMCQL